LSDVLSKRDEMKKKLRNFVKKALFRQELQLLEEQQNTIRVLASATIKSRALVKTLLKKPVKVLFICHEPSLWSMFDSIYQEMDKDLGFSPLVVALPYSHASLPRGQFKDSEIFEFCQQQNIKVIKGYDKEQNVWINPLELLPDYVFFQTPYDLFPSIWSVQQISTIANVCYVPYATSLFRGDVDDILHPELFFKCVYLFFKESNFTRELFVKKLQDNAWLDKGKVIASGHPKLDYIKKNLQLRGSAWRQGIKENITRILWTPRWNTSDGCCHFFDYKSFFTSFCAEHQNIDFTFRPHPLCLQNFLKSGELSADEYKRLLSDYKQSDNQSLDDSPEYHDTFLTCDILVSDVSSMMLEFFATGKPIIYTHRNNLFNEFGQALSDAFYWVTNEQELEATLKQLIAGDDPLFQKRHELMKELIHKTSDGAGREIKNLIQEDFSESSSLSIELF
tara:strand:+ start:4338 stop:5687 length:1350 start_codon:yes stop_codon:yes gene_type:complete